uniref:SWIM-type domain-containing protein n=1 Tax=Lactuca sativa TaxID=4236 RepID=A0A9R1V5G6_LACSA|nr:hypothetical protein LSAT_V11C600303890 [Lactuca sativa]
MHNRVNQNEDGFDFSGDDSDDSDYIVHESNLQFDVDVDMSEFQSAVDVDEHGILNKQTESIGNDIVDEELEVIQSDDYQVGQCFKTKKEVVDYMHAHAVNTRRSLYLAKNDKIRIRVKCGGVVGQSSETVQCGGLLTRSKVKCKGQSTETVECGGPSTRSKVKCKGKNVISKKGKCHWAVQISRPDENKDWLVKTVHDVHKCLQTRSVKACTSKYLANLIVPQIQSNPKIPVKALHEELCKKLELGMSVQKVGKAKQMAERVISGDYQLQYGYLRDYALELLNTNLGSTVRIDVYPEPCLSTTTRTFRRIYGIIPAVAKVFPNAKHRFCLRHIQENLKKQWKGKELSDLVWECGRATTLNHFKYAMDELKKMNDEAHAWLCKIPAETWSKSHFSGKAHTDCLLNNLYEEIKTQAAKYVAKYNGAGKYQVASTWQDQYVVNLNEISCTCRSWEITGFPCKHVVSAIWNKFENGEDAPDVEDWVHPCYKLSTWRAM